MEKNGRHQTRNTSDAESGRISAYRYQVLWQRNSAKISGAWDNSDVRVLLDFCRHGFDRFFFPGKIGISPHAFAEKFRGGGIFENPNGEIRKAVHPRKTAGGGRES